MEADQHEFSPDASNYGVNRSLVFSLLIAVPLMLLNLQPALAEAPPPEKLVYATDAPPGLSPAESQKRFRLPEGFRMELVAAEPQVAEPNGMCFDAHGNLYVCELHGYNLDGYYDILELNKSGVLDKSVRRIPATREAEKKAAAETYGTIRRLTLDAVGRCTGSTVFADRLPPCYGIVAARDGIIALCAPEIIYLKDTKGAGQADVRETLFSGFGVGELWTRISNPRWSFDNWIYAASGGGSRGTIRGPHLKGEVQLGNTCFRFKPDGSQLEPVSGGKEGFGLAIDDWGDRFIVTNQQHALYVAPLPYNDLMRNPFVPTPNPIRNISTYGHPAALFRASAPDPWRLARSKSPEWVKFYGAAETKNDVFTSACSPTLYQADQFPAEYRGNHFTCEPAQNLIHRCILQADGAGYKAVRAIEGAEFLTSTDNWFRPVSMAVGPEGALYVVDMYREVIEDYSAIPRYLQQQYVESLHNGFDKGRIWRIVYGNSPALDADLAAKPREELVAELASPNAWRRLTAQRLIVERQDKSLAPLIESLFVMTPQPFARLHALFALDGLGALPAEPIVKALSDAEPGVRLNALRLAAPRFRDAPELLATALTLTDDTSAKVRLQLAFSLGATDDPRALDALARLAERDGEDPWMQSAVLSSTAESSAQLIAVLLISSKPATAMLRPLAALAAARGAAHELSDCLTTAATHGVSDESRAILAGLIEGLPRSRRKLRLTSSGDESLAKLLHASDERIARDALRVAGLLKLEASHAVTEMREAALAKALSDKLPQDARLAAINSLAGAPRSVLSGLTKLLDIHQPPEIQQAAVKAIGSADAADVTPLLLANWSEKSPAVQTAIIDVVCERRDRLPLLLAAIADKTVDAASIPAVRRSQLLESKDPAIRERAKQLLSGLSTDAERRKALDAYRMSLTLPRRPEEGKAVYEKTCMKCHMLGGRGQKVGPDLSAVQDRPDESILVDILDPSSTIAAGFRAYQVTTSDGRTYTGVMAAETATSITLRREQGAEDTILRRDVEEIVGLKKSLMPEGMEKEITPQQMADLLGYLRQSLKGKK